MALKRGGVRKLLEFLRDLYTLRTLDQFTTDVIGAVPCLIPTDICSYNEMSARRRHAFYKAWPPKHPVIPDAQEILGRYTHQHPLARHIGRNKDLSAHKITDFVSQREFRTTELFNEFYRPLRLPYNMATGLAVNKDTVLAIGLNRVGRDFDANDLALLNIIRPHLLQAFGNAGAVTKMQDEVAAFNLMLEQLDRAIIAVTPAGRIHWATARAQRVLVEYRLREKRGSNWLPLSLRDWLKRQECGLDSREDLPDPMPPLVIDHGSKTLRIRLLRDGNRRLLCMDEGRNEVSVAALKPLSLSPRETEVLCWVAQGKSNPEIGMILSISARTVQKHLERIYVRLGLENRHAAIALAMETARH